ncbi:MAG: TAXI family TRAP transporter solute-binding subunit [Rhizobiaceae bacterium]|nr:TAXI family TRAP transporter solute-binding subunit [Rhizobiaceae bacterium]
MMKTLMAATAALTLTITAASAQVISIATPPQGSVWNTMASVIAAQARENSGLKVTVSPVGGNEAMLRALAAGQAEFTLDDVNDVITATTGTGQWKDKAITNLRIVAKINPFPVGLFVRSDSGMESVSDLEGKTVPSGWDAFPLGRSHIDGILAAGGLTMEDVKGVPVPELIRGVDAMTSGRVDSAFFAVGGPKVAEADASTGGIRFLKIDTDEQSLKRIQQVRPAFYFSKVDPAPFRAGVKEPMEFVTWDNVLVTSADVPDETVSQMLAVLSENKAAIAKAYPPLGAFSIDTAYKPYPGVEYHPGAISFYEDHGIEPVK